MSSGLQMTGSGVRNLTRNLWQLALDDGRERFHGSRKRGEILRTEGV
jgi:hypothetical protein